MNLIEIEQKIISPVLVKKIEHVRNVRNVIWFW